MIQRIGLAIAKPGKNIEMLKKQLHEFKLDTEENLELVQKNAQYDAGILDLIAFLSYAENSHLVITNNNLQLIFANARYAHQIADVIKKLPPSLITQNNFILLLKYKDFAEEIEKEIPELLDQSKFEAILLSFNIKLNDHKMESKEEVGWMQTFRKMF